MKKILSIFILLSSVNVFANHFGLMFQYLTKASPKIYGNVYNFCVQYPTGTVKCSGDNSSFQLGDGTQTASSLPIVSPIVNPISLVVGPYFDICSIMKDGSFQCLGSNNGAQFGTAPASMPSLTTIPYSNTLAASIGQTTSCAITGAGTYCMGTRQYGELGDASTTTNATTPTLISHYPGAKQIALNRTSSCALLADNNIYCGGNAQTTEFTTVTTGAVAVPGFSNVKNMYYGEINLCAIFLDGSVRCTGFNLYGQIATGTTNVSPSSSLPAMTGFSGAIKLAVGAASVCALMPSGSVLCQGRNTSGELGILPMTNVTTPTAVPGITNAVDIAVMDNGIPRFVPFTRITVPGYCALTKNNQVICFGGNSQGSFGNGNTATVTSASVMTNW